VEKMAPEDWEVWHNKGLCLMYIKEYERAAESLRKANSYSKHDSTYLLLARLYALQENYKQAIDVLMEALVCE
jgi:Bardet-Biedl syndrome 4 protein